MTVTRTATMPPIRPGLLTRLANRLHLTRRELTGTLVAIAAGAPVAATAVILLTVPVPQTSSTPFDPARPSSIAPTLASAPPSPEPRAALTAPRSAPRVVPYVIAPTEHRAPATGRTGASPAPAELAGLLCPELIALGHGNIPRGDPLYTRARDGFGPGEPDGIACETDSSTTADPTTRPLETTKPAVPTTEPPVTPGASTVLGAGADVP